MKDKIKEFISNELEELIAAMVLFVVAGVNAVVVNAGSYSDLAGYAKICTIGSMAILGALFIKGLIIPAGYALLKLLKIVK